MVETIAVNIYPQNSIVEPVVYCHLLPHSVAHAIIVYCSNLVMIIIQAIPFI